ncbi:MAG: patatin-like phospholipase family protein [Candidatus Omnitrophica bacterium]|nr:patatin-like phospholipase family protein [Candidatus Omnitrophota bacterium]
MGFFEFGKKIDLGKEYSLEDIPLFSSLTNSDQKLVEKKGRLVQYRRGDTVYDEGTKADAFYVVISGRFRLFHASPSHATEQTLLYFYRGDHFGETSLLTGRPHSATVEAKSDGLILRLEKEDFLKLVNDIPAISLHLSRTLGHRLTKSEAAGHRREVKIAAFCTQGNPQEVFHLWIDFAAAVAHETKRKVLIVDFVSERNPRFREEFHRESQTSYDLSQSENPREGEFNAALVEHPAGFYYAHILSDSVAGKDEKRVSSLLTFLTYRYDYLMIRLPRNMGHVSFEGLKQSDTVYVHCEADKQSLTACSESLQELVQGFGFSKRDVKVIAPDKNIKDENTFSEFEKILGFRIFSLVPEREDKSKKYQTSLRYLAKEWAGTLVGLALGSGAAYGLAHIGVLQVLEEENIPIDVVSGSSIGALVGGLWAAGYSAQELKELALGINKRTGFFKLLGFQDLSLAHWGFFKGHQVNRFIKSYIGNKTFQETRIPLRIIGTNLFTSEAVTFEAGRIVDAIRASISIPGIFRPFFYKGDCLIDGGVIDPLPVKVLSQMGVKKIIAVNVLLGPKDRIERNRLIQETQAQKMKQFASKSMWGKISMEMAEAFKTRYAINIFNVIMNTIQFMEYEMAETWGHKADVLIHPVVYEGNWAQFYDPVKFIKAGEEKTREQLTEIKRLLAE